jgi:hypothetical protein
MVRAEIPDGFVADKMHVRLLIFVIGGGGI